MTRDYSYYKEIFSGREMPLAFIDLDLFDENAKQISARAKGKTIRIASKSVRCVELLRRALKSDPAYKGIMTYSGAETVWLSQTGFDDLLIGYPVWHQRQIEHLCLELKKGKSITLMADLPEHVLHLNRIGENCNTIIPICIDIDMTSVFPGVRFGVWRSSIHQIRQAQELHRVIKNAPFVRLDGVMGYEAAIAGMGDNAQGKMLQNIAVKFFKKSSAREIPKRRGEIVSALENDGAQLRLVNGGGTGSLEWTTDEDWVTEVTVGSGFYSSALFDNYTNFKHLPAAAFAVEITRHPSKNIFTCHGGGYIASGSIGVDKQPKPYLPAGFTLLGQEGTGEVQTPVVYSGNENLQLGDPVLFRHAKAGELCERFNSLLLVSQGKIADEVPTYRGEGKCFA